MVKDTVITGRPASHVFNSKGNSTAAIQKLQEAQNENSSKDTQLMQQQNYLYRQYSEQSSSLAKDIDRLNTQMAMARQDNTSQPNVVYQVTPGNAYNNPPYNMNSSNANDLLPVAAKPEKIVDTIYIRDTVISVVNLKETNPKEAKAEKPTTEKPGFNYAGMPAEIILFGVGKSTVQPIYEDRLNFIANILIKDSGLYVTATGHTDATGSKEINDKLSLRRAQSVAAYLMDKGVADKQIIVKSLSFEKPAVSGNSKTARSQNRRVVMKLVNK